jgi:hypothetical protein
MPSGPAAASSLIIDGDELLAVEDQEVKFKSLEEVHRMIWQVHLPEERKKLLKG